MPTTIVYPVRINKYLALKNIASRREADELIRTGQVRINGHKAELGDKVQEKDKVELAITKKRKQLVYLAFNKPKGVVTHSAQGQERAIEHILKTPVPVFPVGRLDKRSCGLIILTNDGRVTDKLLNPIYAREKEYCVIVDKPLTKSFMRKMSQGVTLDDGYTTKPCELWPAGKEMFYIILTEGKNRQIRRMCERLKYAVVSLKRVRIMNIELGNTKAGEYREIKGEELEWFLKGLKIA